MIIPVLMPIDPMRIVPEPVLTSLLTQGIPINLIMSNAIGTGAAQARQHLKDMLKSDPGYVMTTDNDIVLEKGSLLAMLDFMERNSDFGGIVISKHFRPVQVQEGRHVDASPALYRSSIYNQITYHNRDGCECMGIANDIRNLGYRIGFLDNFQCEHIMDTKRRVHHG